MKSNYKKVGDFISLVKEKNRESLYSELLGINIDKFFMPSVANIQGVDLSAYKVVRKNQFACNRMHVGRDYRIPISLSHRDEPFLVSPAYDVFEIKDTSILLPEYLMMWFSRKEFDRNAWFYTDADVRGGLPWSSFCEIELPIPSIEKQREIVKEYNTVVNRIQLNEQLNQKLEETAQDFYNEFIEGAKQKIEGTVMDFMLSANTGLDAIKRAPIVERDTGLKCLRIQDVSKNKGFDDWGFSKVEEQNYKKFQLKKDDIIIARTGATVGTNMLIKQNLKAVFNNGLIRVRANREKIYPSILFAFFNTQHFKEHVDSIAFGTSTQPNVKIGDLFSIEVSFPSIEVQNKIVNCFEALNFSMFNYKNEIGVLLKMEELLLTKMTKLEETTEKEMI